MLKTGMYVRCSIDVEDPSEPRDFISGRIVEVNDFSETAKVKFFDLIDLKKYYQVPETLEFPLSKLQHCRISNGSQAEYSGIRYYVVQYSTDKNDEFIYYYLANDTRTVVKVCEKDIKVTFNAGEISPLSQLKRFEFQNPMWYFGRSAVNRTIHTIDNAFYGFKELAGCKIFLKPYQLKTVMRCLSEPNCRYMIADEVGLGKTIEAASVLKVYLSDKKSKKILICVPDALVEQWKTELAFKFRLFEGENLNSNYIKIVPMSKVAVANGKYDFVVVDEVHSVLNNELRYEAVLRLSRTTDNVIMLSATPVQSRNEEYHKLLSLIQPDRYYGMNESKFLELLELQNKIVRKVHAAVSYLDDYKEAIKESDNEHSEDTREAYDELVDTLEDIADKTNDKKIEEDIENFSYEAENFSLLRIERTVAYICEAYQLEKCIIRNRKKPEDTNNRVLKQIPYEMDTEFNNTEFRIYSLLSDWISGKRFDKKDFDSSILPLISAFFSSSSAFSDELKKNRSVPAEIRELTAKWISEDINTIKNIRRILDDPMDSMSRMVAVCDYLEQEAYDKKVLIFTHFTGTHRLFRQLLTKVFGEDHCTFFCEGMSPDELELNTYRFQNEPGYRIMLSDETGGEGRNFQKADELICIDLPWSANTLEQRIGRLDRIGRDKTKDVVSVIVYAEDSVEKDLADIWNKGLNIFKKSQSGLEIIMNDIDEQIRTAVMNDFKYGLSSIVDSMISEIQKIEKQVKEERHFDIAAYTYQYINKEIEKTVKRYNENESELFRNSMMSWSSLAGFRGNSVTENVVRFNASSFSPKSAYNTMFVPPDMDMMIKDKLNQMQNHIRELNGDKAIQNDIHSIQGTFDRNLALSNDYLHFFAPVIIVPTISLMLDQQRNAANIIEPENKKEIMYYHSGCNVDELVNAIDKKLVKMLFVSPEALIKNIRIQNSIFKANSEGYLKNLVIDEAHIIIEWGASFRVDFQCLDSFRRLLAKDNPILRTFLLSATFSKKTVDNLKLFYSDNDRWIEIRLDTLRKEPRFDVIKCRSYTEKHTRIKELACKLPRPMIIYVNSPDDAETIRSELAECGFDNTRVFTGRTGSADRERIIKEWVNDKFDLMIATCAFGVGVDKKDVRTVIHSYVPSGPDQYYQECGRGGRDGIPCLGVMLYTDDDIAAAMSMTQKVLTVEKLSGRWFSMLNSRKANIQLDSIVIDTSVKPNYNDTDTFYVEVNNADITWNVYVILLLRRAGLIQITDVKYYDNRYIFNIELIDKRIRYDTAQTADIFSKVRDDESKSIYSDINELASKLRRIGKSCWSSMFNDIYLLTDEYCAGCNNHNNIRTEKRKSFPLKKPVYYPVSVPKGKLCDIMNSAEEMLIICENDSDALVQDLFAAGADIIVMPDEKSCASELQNINYVIPTQCCMGYSEFFELSRMNSHYYLSGIVVFCINDDFTLAGKLLNTASGKEYHRIYVVSSDFYVSGRNKNISELVNGACKYDYIIKKELT